MTVNLQTVNDRYGSYIWAIAVRYHTGIWDEEDVFEEVLLRLYVAVKSGKIPFNDDPTSILQVKGYIISRAIDILRIEMRRYMTHFDDDEVDIPKPMASESPESQDFELRLIKELLFSKLDAESAEFMYELAFPSSTTVRIAIREQEKSKTKAVNGELKMNIHKLRILPKHVSKMYMLKKNKKITKQKIAEMRGKAQKALRDYFNVTSMNDVEDVVSELLGVE